MIIVDKYDDDIVNMSRTFGVGWGFLSRSIIITMLAYVLRDINFFYLKNKNKKHLGFVGFYSK